MRESNLAVVLPASPLFPAEQLALLRSLNETRAALTDNLLHSGFEEQAVRAPGLMALMSGSVQMSYEELHALARGLSAQLRALGARRNTLVALVMEKGWEQVAGVLGVVMSGAGYLPLDARWPAERLAQLLEECQVSVVLTQSAVLRRWQAPSGVQTICVDEQRGRPWSGPSGESAQADDLAYVIYTSGSTGRPKGVTITHRAALNTVQDINERFAVGAQDRVLGLSSLSFDLSVYDIFGTLSAGACLVLPSAPQERDPSHWWELIGRHGVTIWNSVPALMELLVDYGRRVGARGAAGIGSVRLAMLSGDWIGLTLPDAIRGLAPHCAVVSLGGATEAGIWSVIYPIGTVEAGWTSIPYGRPMKNQRLYVLNEACQLCPVWARGSLYIAGEGLAQGYWRDAQRTAASFINHPQTGERMYRTGDLARYRPDGCIELLGREDLQIKLHGHRIEPGEIEAVMLQHPGVTQAAVVAQHNARGNQQLAAFVVFAPAQRASDAPAREQELKSFLVGKLPQHLIPARLIAIDVLPRTENDKIDRAALGRQELAEADGGAPASAADSEILDAIAEIVAEILGIEHCAGPQRLLDLGADSVAVIRIANALEERFGHRPSLELLFRNASLEDIAGELSAVPA
jgi:pyochelin synthetase